MELDPHLTKQLVSLADLLTNSSEQARMLPPPADLNSDLEPEPEKRRVTFHPTSISEQGHSSRHYFGPDSSSEGGRQPVGQPRHSRNCR
jgi:hypothetical protein